MKKKQYKSFGIILISIVSSLLFSFSAENEKSVNDFSLLNVDGKMVSLKDYPSAKGFIIIFTCNHCPFAKLYPERMNKLNNKYESSGVPLIAISSTDTVTYEDDSYINMIQKAKDEKFNFPYLSDGEQSAAKNFGAQKTPHAFVVWKEKGEYLIKYSGAIDDNGAEPEKVKNSYVEKAVDALLKGKAVELKETKSIGCQIHIRK
jgi:peroxiredoxin